MTWVSQDVQAANEVGRKERLTTLSESYAVGREEGSEGGLGVIVLENDGGYFDGVEGK